MYKTQRNYENLNKALFDGVGEYGIPVIQPSDFRADNWIGFNYAKGCDRWDTIPGITKTTSKPTAAQKKLAAEINAQRAKKKKK